MFNLFRATPKPDRAAILARVPTRNQLVREVETLDGKLRLTAPLKRKVVHRLFGSAAREKTFELDDLGRQVWGAVDDRATVEQIITAFAARNRVNLREAEVSVTTFLNMLIQRNLVALVGKDGAGRAKKSPAKRQNRAQRRAAMKRERK